jgi:RNA polymerase sporulation-specific sigma factor
MYILSDNNSNNPLESSIKEEDLKELADSIKEVLSDSEYEVYLLMISGLNYNEISILLDKSLKQVDNTIQRIKNKVKKIIDK